MFHTPNFSPINSETLPQLGNPGGRRGRLYYPMLTLFSSSRPRISVKPGISSSLTKKGIIYEVNYDPTWDPAGAMHYRLRPIKRGQFRFSNFPSHFISVQIFQIDLSTLPLILSVSKYFRYAFRTQNESFSSSTAIIKQLGEEKGTS